MANKRYKTAKEKIESTKNYNVEDAFNLVVESATAKFDESIEVAIRLGVDPKQSDQQVRGAVALPNGLGKDVRVIVFAKGPKEAEAKEAGADFVGADDLVEKIKGGWLDFDKAIATPDMMATVSKVAKILGPRGLMPNPKVGTVTPDVATAVKNAKAGQVRYRTDKNGIRHTIVGNVGFSADSIKQNVEALLVDLKKAKPASAKGVFMKKITLSSTMGPGLVIDQSSISF